MDVDTTLRRFMKTAAGVAIGAAIASALHPPPAVSQFASHEAASAGPPAGRQASLFRTEAQSAVLERAIERLTDRNVDIRDALDGVIGLHAELRHLLVEKHEISVRDQARLFRDAMMDWLEDRKAGRPTSVTASFIEASTHLDSGRPLDPEGYVKSLAALANDLIASNAALEGSLRGMASAMDEFVREASEGGDPDSAIDAFERWSAMVGSYAALPHAAYEGQDPPSSAPM